MRVTEVKCSALFLGQHNCKKAQLLKKLDNLFNDTASPPYSGGEYFQQTFEFRQLSRAELCQGDALKSLIVQSAAMIGRQSLTMTIAHKNDETQVFI